MPDAAEYAQYMQVGRCGNCGGKRIKESTHYCARCLASHRKYQREAMREKRRSNDFFRVCENEKQRERMRILRAKRREAKQAIVMAIRDARNAIRAHRRASKSSSR